MLAVVLLLLFQPLFTPCTAGAVSAGQSAPRDTVDLQTQIDRLRTYYQDASRLDSAAARCAKRLYLEYFPENFDRFVKVYTEELHDISHLVKFLPKVKVINNKKYAEKIVSVSVGGEWRVAGTEAPNHLLHKMRNLVGEEPNIVYDILKDYSEDKVSSFWYFYFDGPHPMDVIPNAVKKIQEWDPEMYEIAKEEYEESKKRLEGH